MERGVILRREMALTDIIKAKALFEKYDSEMQVYLKFLEKEAVPGSALKDMKEFIRKVQECRLHTVDTITKYSLYLDKFLEKTEAGEA